MLGGKRVAAFGWLGPRCGMAMRFVSIDRGTPLALPPNLGTWVPAGHLVHFLLEAVEAFDLRQAKANTRGTGNAPSLQDELNLPAEIIRWQARQAALARARNWFVQPEKSAV